MTNIPIPETGFQCFMSWKLVSETERILILLWHIFFGFGYV